MKKSKFKFNKKTIIIIAVLLLLIGVVITILLINKNSKSKTAPKVEEIIDEVSIVDINSKSRPYAVMINNIDDARTVQSGLNKAYLVYEIIVEGGITRYLALFKDVENATIGSVRSSRHYYLDYALENDAIYVHWGWSPQAEADIKSLKINNINGLSYDGSYFYRINTIGAPHNGFTSMELLKKATEKLKYRTDTDKGLLLQYSSKNVDLSSHGEIIPAAKFEINYSNYTKNTYEYDEETEKYIRMVGSNKQIDHEDDSIVKVKNIIAYRIKNYSIAGDPKGRQFLDNIGTGEGYYISNGQAIKIKWSKETREGKTQYTYEDGKELVVNDGNTFIQIIPEDGLIELG